MALLIGSRSGFIVFEEDNGTYRIDKGTIMSE